MRTNEEMRTLAGPCQAMTHRLNCGCCDEVRLDCQLYRDHPGPHEAQDLSRYDHLKVAWEYEPGWTAGTGATAGRPVPVEASR